MLRGFFGNLIFAIIAWILCGNHPKPQSVSLVSQTESKFVLAFKLDALKAFL